MVIGKTFFVQTLAIKENLVKAIFFVKHDLRLKPSNIFLNPDLRQKLCSVYAIGLHQISAYTRFIPIFLELCNNNVTYFSFRQLLNKSFNFKTAESSVPLLCQLLALAVGFNEKNPAYGRN